MDLSLFIYLSCLSFSVIIILILIIIALQKRKVLGASAFAGLLSAGFFYAFGSIFEITSVSVQTIHFWLSVEYLGIACLGPFWFILARTLADKMSPESKKLIPLYFILPVLVFIAVATNNFHKLFYTSIDISYSGPFTIPVLGKGPIYWISMIYMNAMILSGAVVSCEQFIRAAPVYKKQSAMLFLASLMPWIGMFIYQLGLSPYHLDIAPLGITLSVIIFAWAMFRYRLFDLSPIVHENVFEGMRDGVAVFDTKWRFLGANPAIRAIVKELSYNKIGENAYELLKERGDLLKILTDKNEQKAELSILIDDKRKYYELTVGDMKNSKGRILGSILTMTDVSTQAELLELLREQATTDQLTGIHNRRSFFELAKHELERAKRNQSCLSLIMIDIDHFKIINDTFGHLAGDEVLKECTRVWTKELRTIDIFGRFGGEEFVALLPDTGVKEAMKIAERLRKAMEKSSCTCNEKTTCISASFGVSGRELVSDLELETIIHESDTALYEAKKNGRNKVMCYTEEMESAE